MRLSLLVLPLLTTSAVAQSSEPSKPVPQAPVTLKHVATLSDHGGGPTTFTADGKRIVYLKKAPPRAAPVGGGAGRAVRPMHRSVFIRCDSDGKNPTEIFATDARADVLIGCTSPQMASADGRALVLPASHGRGRRAPVVPVVLRGAANAVQVKTKLPWAMGFGYTGQELVVLETNSSFRGPGGYRLVRHGEKGVDVVEERDAGAVFGLRVSPDGKKAAVLMVDLASRGMRVRVVDLKTKRAVESPAFRTEALVFHGLPVVHWDAKSAGIYLNRIPANGNRRGFQLARFDIAKKAVSPVVPFKAIGVTAVLDANHLAVLDKQNDRAGILRLSDQALFLIPGQKVVLGGRGKRIVVSTENQPQVTLEELSLPKQVNPTGK